MRTWSSVLAILAGLSACSNSDSPIPKEPPSAVARLAAQACACTFVECLRPFKAQLDGMIASQHQGGNAGRENAEARAKIAQCEARLSAAK
ncbi:MAG: hypothetical protein R3B48_23235 [Kofleriaceae bacterium]